MAPCSWKASSRPPPAARARDEADVHWHGRLVALAASACQALQRRVPWPLDLGVRDGQAMRSWTRCAPPTGFAVNYRALGFRPPMLLSSLGRCYLAFCLPAERREILETLSRSCSQADIAARRPERIQRLLASAAAQGYATRDPSHTEADSADRFGAISVPVRLGGSALACISISWLPAVASEPQIVQAHLKVLQEAAAAIEQRLAREDFAAIRARPARARATPQAGAPATAAARSGSGRPGPPGRAG